MIGSNTAIVAGVDGCPGGWVAAVWDIRRGSVRGTFGGSVAEVMRFAGAGTAIGFDMPVGLPDAGDRECDRLARKRLGPRRNSVFPAPLRSALDADDRAEADRITRAIDGRGVGAQAWQLYAKIGELDRWLGTNPGAAPDVYEIHPELSFAAMNGGEPMIHPKKRFAGGLARWRLLERAMPAGAFDRLRDELSPGIGDDDILDALACAWSARRVVEERAGCLPAEPPRDATGLEMAIRF